MHTRMPTSFEIYIFYKTVYVMMRVREFIYGIISTSEYVGAQQASDMEVEVQSLIQSLRSLIFVF